VTPLDLNEAKFDGAGTLPPYATYGAMMDEIFYFLEIPPEMVILTSADALIGVASPKLELFMLRLLEAMIFPADVFYVIPVTVFLMIYFGWKLTADFIA
jgi:hypothetical protein